MKRPLVLILPFVTSVAISAQTRADTEQIAVIRAVLRANQADTSSIIAIASDTSRICGEYRLISRRRVPCGSDSLRAAFSAALDNFFHRNAVPDTSPASLVGSLGPHIAERFRVDSAHPCGGPVYYSFSRVGFDPSFRRAVVVVDAVEGRGPYPGCGWVRHTTLFVERGTDGTWSEMHPVAVRIT